MTSFMLWTVNAWVKMGAADYLNKPIDLNKLRSRISLLMSEVQIRFRAATLDHDSLMLISFGESSLVVPLCWKCFRGFAESRRTTALR